MAQAVGAADRGRHGAAERGDGAPHAADWASQIVMQGSGDKGDRAAGVDGGYRLEPRKWPSSAMI